MHLPRYPPPSKETLVSFPVLTRGPLSYCLHVHEALILPPSGPQLPRPGFSPAPRRSAWSHTTATPRAAAAPLTLAQWWRAEGGLALLPGSCQASVL